MNRFLKHLSLTASAVCCTVVSPAIQAEPSKAPVIIVVPYGAGGNGDLAARALTSALQKHKDVPPLVVVNKAGAGGVTGSQFVIDAPPDGKTLLLARVGSQVVAPALDPAAAYKWSSVTFLGLLETDPYVCVVAKNSPFRTIKDLLVAIKEKPGKLSYASSGNMDASVVFPTKMTLNLGLSPDALLKVPYRGGAETLTAVLGGQVDFTCNAINPYMASINGGSLRALVVSTPKRLAQLPDVPTVGEIGMKNLEMVSGWSALVGPPGLPKEVVAKWSGLLSRLRDDRMWLDQVKNRGALPTILEPQETLKFVEQQFNDYHALRDHIKVAN